MAATFPLAHLDALVSAAIEFGLIDRTRADAAIWTLQYRGDPSAPAPELVPGPVASNLHPIAVCKAAEHYLHQTASESTVGAIFARALVDQVRTAAAMCLPQQDRVLELRDGQLVPAYHRSPIFRRTPWEITSLKDLPTTPATPPIGSRQPDLAPANQPLTNTVPNGWEAPRSGAHQRPPTAGGTDKTPRPVTLAPPDHDKLVRYLSARGWSASGKTSNGMPLWTHPGNRQAMIPIPPRIEFDDDTEWLLRAVHTLATLEHRRVVAELLTEISQEPDGLNTECMGTVIAAAPRRGSCEHIGPAHPPETQLELEGPGSESGVDI
ncbi:hypothetical protein [Nocardia suismassiliense]|uniref:hypothetical protein n=1 Tax=Nocardia suismassiliense TaxID=2077092 RepID=UPI00131F3646|nr:hypothetical protein [Nocardia suismassiliense]